jgi:MFS superfamily sulfate permease-like transporter
VANIGAALSGTFVVNGSPTKTQMVDSAGGRSQLGQIVASLIVLLLLLFFTAPLAYMPEAVLAAVVFLIGAELIDLKGMARIYAERPWEFWVASITTAVVVFWGVEQGILLAIFLSLAAHTRHGYRPKNTVVVRNAAGKWHVLPVSRPQYIVPGLLVYRFSHSMYYANTAQLAEEVLFLIKQAKPPMKWFCLDCAAVDDVDFSAAEALRDLQNVMKEQGVRLVLSSVSDDLKAALRRSGLVKRVGSSAFFASIEDVLDAYGS